MSEDCNMKCEMDPLLSVNISENANNNGDNDPLLHDLHSKVT